MRAEDTRRYAKLLKPRRKDAHKGHFGHLLIVGGSRERSGAVLLAARGALRAGAGWVSAAVPREIQNRVSRALPELLTFGFSEPRDLLHWIQRSRVSAVVVGPGLGTAPSTVRFLEGLLPRLTVPLVIDADALNAFAGRPEFFRRLHAPSVLTPHAAEAGRLLKKTPAQVQKERLAVLAALVRRTNHVVLLKGHRTLIGQQNRVAENRSGGPYLAQAGMGDVLSGVIGTLLARGVPAYEAACLGAYWHGRAGARAAKNDFGVLASEVADALPTALKK